MEEYEDTTMKCPKCNKIMTLWISDAFPDKSEFRHKDGSEDHIIDTSNYPSKRPFWKIW